MRHRALVTLMIAPLMLAPVASQGSPSSELEKLASDYWEGHLKANPVTATSVGDRRYDDLLSDNTPTGRARDILRLETVLARAQAIDASDLSLEEQLNRTSLIEGVERQLARYSCGFHEWVVDPLRGPHVWIFNLADITTIESPGDADNFVKRCQAFRRWMDRHIGGLRTGLDAGKVASRDAIRKSVEQLETTLAQPIDEWAVLAPAKREYEGWSPRHYERFEKELRQTAENQIKPALSQYHEFLRSELMPHARSQEEAGLGALPDGAECYQKMILVNTSLDWDARKIHEIGLEHVARFREDLSRLGARVLGTDDVAEIQKKLREDPEMHFTTSEEVATKAEEALGRARGAIPAWFGILPQAPCEVKVMGMHEAPHSTIAYYRRPAFDGSRPGYYMINTYKPETRPRYEAEALAFHEAIPGHHLQIAIMQELGELPTFRKQMGVTAFTEGWALYTERLCDDMGLYSSDLDRIGMLSYDAWRSCRLVVDTGMHAMGWSRQQAIDFMLENTILAENNIVNEVDRYLTWPGQALAYKLGQIEILALRDEAREALGDAFDIKGFHDAVLSNGAVSLPQLRRQVEAWITASR